MNQPSVPNVTHPSNAGITALFVLAGGVAVVMLPGRLHAQAAHFPKRLQVDPIERLEAQEKAYRQDLEQAAKDYGEDDLRTAPARQRLARFYADAGDLARAEPLYQRVVEAYRAGLESPGAAGTKVTAVSLVDLARVLRGLANVHLQRGDYVGAWPLLQETLTLVEKAGTDDPQYADAINGLAELTMQTGDYARALPLYQQVVAIRKQVPGGKQRDYAASLHNLGLLYQRMGKYEKAEPLLRQDLEITASDLGEDHPEYAQSLAGLALLYTRTGEYQRAEAMFQQAIAVYEKALGKSHPACIRTRSNFGFLSIHMGEYDRAEALLTEAVRMGRRTLGATHPDTADSLNDLATLSYAKGDLATAALKSRAALQITRQNMELTSVLQSERQQLAMARRFREWLDQHLSIAISAGLPAADVYRELLVWKGSVFRRQRQLRMARTDPQCADLLADLERVSAELAKMALSSQSDGEDDERQSEIAALRLRRGRLEGELATKSAAFRLAKMQQQRTAEDLQAVLPPGFALIDFLEYAHWKFDSEGKLSKGPRLLAFVVRADRPVALVQFGHLEPIAAAIGRWRSDLGGSGLETGPSTADLLRTLLWEPLQPHLAGANNLFISPVGEVAKIPWYAISGERPGTYLIEDCSIALLPVPQLLPDLLQEPDSSSEGESQPEVEESSLLALGDVDYGAPAGVPQQGEASNRSAVRSARRGFLAEFDPLDFTRGEILAVRDSFELAYPEGRVAMLRRDRASEGAFRTLAPRYRVLHLATHGFFAPAELRSALMPSSLTDGEGEVSRDSGAGPVAASGMGGFHPGLLSGVVLAGANGPLLPDHHDGILTALEVAEMDLRKVDLAVLSACETGLGEVAGGEGLLGLQRAFQVAGTRCVVASLWKVDDDATRKLMERFYQNLWEHKMSKLEAFRSAQLWMLREGGLRDVRLRPKNPEHVEKYAPPRLWAAFVLSGDWR